MNLTKLTIPKFYIGKKLVATILIAATTIASFGALGDGNKKSDFPKKFPFLSGKTYSQNSFSLRSGYTYRGSRVLPTQSNNQYINLNTVVTHQRGNTTYIVPLKKKVILDKVKIELGNRQFQRN
ncbi:MAG: hypothetical protein ABIP79_02775 [Chitinophagaceae bacterium]